MPKYRNIAEGRRRVWPNIQLSDGSTLELDAGETVVLDEPVDDPNLELVKKKLTKKEQEEEDAKKKEEEDAAAAEAAATETTTEENKS